MIRVNDRLDIEWKKDMTIRDLLVACKFTFPLINVMVDGTLVSKEEYETYILEDGADVRVIHLITGG